MSLKYKFVSSGQSVDDAAIVSQIINGISLRPPMPVNVTGTRILNDWLFQFDPPPNTKDPAEYVIDIVNVSTGALIRSIPVTADLRQAMYLIDYNPTYDTIQRSTNYGIRFIPSFSIFASPPKVIGHARSPQSLEGFTYEVEAVFEEYDVTFSGATLGLILESTALSIDATNGNETTPIPFAIHAAPAGGFQSAIQAVENGTVMASITISSPGSGQLSKLAKIGVLGSEVQYIYDGTLFYKSKKVPIGPYRGFVSAEMAADGMSSDVVSHLKMGVGTETYSTIYSERQQQNDFGSAQSSVRARIYQILRFPNIVKGQAFDKVFT